MADGRPRPLVAGNWKMNGLKASTATLAAITNGYDLPLHAIRQHQWRIHPVIDQGNIKMSCDHQSGRLVGLPLGNPKPELPMFLAEPSHSLGQDGPSRRGKPGDLQITNNTFAFPVELALRALDLGKNCVRSPRQQDACWRQPYAAPVRLDEPLAHVALQLAKLLGHRRRRQS